MKRENNNKIKLWGGGGRSPWDCQFTDKEEEIPINKVYAFCNPTPFIIKA